MQLKQYEISQKGVAYICDPKRGMCTDINADISQTVTSKGQSNWTGSFVSQDIDHLEKSKTIGSKGYTKIVSKDGNVELFGGGKLEKQYRIRKLTPMECYRLMGVKDEDSKKMLEVNSNSQCYKQAGNSIVVDVIMAMFSNLGIEGD